jgi:tetratricopeptide (TPR) repeat protein
MTRIALCILAFAWMTIDGYQAVPAEPDNQTATEPDTFEKGISALQQRDFDAAIAAFTELIQQDQNDVDAYYNRGIAYAEKGDLDKAIADQSAAIRLDPEDAQAYYNRGRAYLQKSEDNFQQAKQLGHKPQS